MVFCTKGKKSAAPDLRSDNTMLQRVERAGGLVNVVERRSLGDVAGMNWVEKAIAVEFKSTPLIRLVVDINDRPSLLDELSKARKRWKRNQRTKQVNEKKD
jgi:hypothetical protein